MNGSVEYLGITNFHKTGGTMWADNLLDPRYSWGDGGTTNQNWEVQLGGPHSNVTMVWGSTVPACPTFMPRSKENLRVTAHCVRDDFCCARHR